MMSVFAEDGAVPKPPRNWRVVLAVIALVSVLTFVESVQQLSGGFIRGAEVAWKREVLSNASTWFALGLLVAPIVWLARRFDILTANTRVIALHVIASLLFPIVHLSIAMVGWYWAFLRFQPDLDLWQVLGRATRTHYVMEMLLYWLVVGAYSAWRAQQAARASAIEAANAAARSAQLESTLTQAKLSALRGQIHPHFLFNTLNVITVLADQRRYRAVTRVATQLGQLLRSSIDQVDQHVALQSELQFLRRYLNIEKVRFGERLRVRYRVDEDVLNTSIPSLILQPLVENALKHGVANSVEPVLVEIGAERRNGALHLWVRDTGPGVGNTTNPIRERIGLMNVRERLEQLHGSSARLSLSNQDRGGGFCASIDIPVDTQPHP